MTTGRAAARNSAAAGPKNAAAAGSRISAASTSASSSSAAAGSRAPASASSASSPRSAAAGSLRALEVATRAIASELDVDRVLQLIVDSVRGLVAARYAALGIVDERGGIERFITSGMTAEERAAIGPPPQGHGLLGRIIRDGVALRVPDTETHPDRYGFPPNHPPMRSLLGVPIRLGDRAIGNLYLTDRADGLPFDDGDEELVELFAIHAAIAIEHARLHARVQDLALVDERLRISRDLHDGIIQAIYAVSLSLEDVPELIERDPAEAADRVDRAIDRLHTSIADIRRFVTELGNEAWTPPLGERLEAVALQARGNQPIEIRLDVHAADELEGRLTPEAEHELVQIAREALSNVARHSRATRASLSLRPAERSDHVVVLRVEDDGVGFDPKRRRGPGHFGLANLRDRAAAVGGTTRIESAPGRGTRIIVRLPISHRGSALS